MKKRRKIIIIVIAAIVFIAVGGIFVLNAFIGTNKFKDMLTGMMEKQLQAKVSIDQWEASIFSGIEFTNLSVDQPAGFGTGKLLKTPRFAMKFNLWDLLMKKITLSKIIIDDLMVNLNENSEGLWFFQTISSQDKTESTQDKTDEERQKVEKQKKSTKTASPLNNLIILAETINIKNANFLAKDHNGNIIGELKNANINGKINIQGGKNDVLLNLNSSAIALSNKITGLYDNISIENLEANVRIDKSKAQLQNLSLDIFNGNIKAKIAALNYQSDQPEVDMDIQVSNLSPAPVLSIVGQPKDTLAAPLTCSVTTKLKIESAESLREPIGRLRKNQAFVKVDQNMLPALCELLDNINHLETNIKLDKIQVNNIGSLQNLTIDKVNLPIRINKRTIILDEISIDIWGGKFLTSLNSDIGTDSIVLKADIQSKNIKSTPLLAIANLEKDMLEGHLNSHIMLEGSIKNPLPFTMEIIDNSVINGSVSIGEIVTKPAGKIDKIAVPIKLEKGRLSMQPIVKAFQGELKAVLNAYNIANFQPETTGSLPTFEIETSISNMDSGLLLQAAGVDERILSGPLNLNLTAAGKGNSLTNLDTNGSIHIPSINVDIAGNVVDDINGQLQFTNQVAVIEDFSANISGGSITVQGSYDLTNETHEGNVSLESLDVANATEGFVKDNRYIKHFLDTTKVMTGAATGVAKVAGNLDNVDSMKGTFHFGINDGVISGHPIQLRLSKVLDMPELNNIEFSQIDTEGSLDGLLVNLDYLDLKSQTIALNATNGIIDMGNDTLFLLVEIGLSPEIAAKLDKPVEEIKYGLTEKADGLQYLPTFNITGSISKPNIKKALVEVLLKSAAKGFLKKEIFKTVGREKQKGEGKETEVEDEKKKGKDIIDDMIDGIFGGKKEEKDKGDKEKSTQDVIKEIFGF